mgnify:CR=1 FL=1
MSETQTAKIKWHPYPEVPLPKTEFAEEYLVTAIPKGLTKPVILMAYASVNFNTYRDSFEVTAWAELPKPYTPPPPLDMHPDAVYAREFMEIERRRKGF